ncbi:putative mediator complex subunit med1 [Diplodia seriata]|uniref:Mediator of RNA polymerase II transcription subunit 1 n=1 Tax=Diplodia seriata TaxID=420778 RepID=A0A0G2DUR1_9PEZI|nr:putative mediator complex subunit med1 [Diplodia seriata]
MSTPTNHPARHPPQAPNAAGTPSQQHLGTFSSPAPRSVPSPAAQRSTQQAGKSPFNTTSGASGPAMAASAGGSGGGGGGALGFDSPGALNLGLNALAGLEGGVGMGISMSGMSGLGLGMGLTSSMGGRPDDTEQRKRLEAIIATLKARPGRVSREGMERLARQLGLSSEVMSDSHGGQQLLLAHTSFMLDIAFRDNVVDGVTLQFGDLSGGVQTHSQSAATVFKADLVPAPGEASINLSLDRFAKNLEKLARLDHLSIFKEGKPEVSCFEAIAGVYNSLQKLFEHERKAAMHLIGKLPNVRFVAKLNPPLVVPLNTAQNILTSVNVQMNQESLKWSTSLEALVLKPDDEPTTGLTTEFTKEYHNVRNVFVVDKNGKEQDKRHEATLYVNKAEVACVLDEIPFDHPRQLIQILPVLRQYAHLTTLLQSALQPSQPSNQPTQNGNKNNNNIATPPPDDENADALPPTLPISISLTGIDPSGTSSPTLTVTYPRPSPPASGHHHYHPPSNQPIESLDDLLAGLSFTPPPFSFADNDDDDDTAAADMDTAMSGGGTDADLFGEPAATNNNNNGADKKSFLFDPSVPPPTVTLAVSVLPNADVAIVAQDLLPELVPMMHQDATGGKAKGGE